MRYAALCRCKAGILASWKQERDPPRKGVAEQEDPTLSTLDREARCRQWTTRLHHRCLGGLLDGKGRASKAANSPCCMLRFGASQGP